MAWLDPDLLELFEETAWKPAFLWEYVRPSQNFKSLNISARQ